MSAESHNVNETSHLTISISCPSLLQQSNLIRNMGEIWLTVVET